MIFHVQFGKLCILLFKLYEVGYLEQERGSRTNFDTLVKLSLTACCFSLGGGGGVVAEATTTRASRRSKRVTRGQPVTPRKINSDTSHKIWRHPDRYFPYSLV